MNLEKWIKKAKDRFFCAYGREPTIMEMAAIMNRYIRFQEDMCEEWGKE